MTGKNLAVVFGIVFVLVGILGLVGGAGIVGPDGLFATNVPHDLVHLLSGIVFLIVAFSTPRYSSPVLMIFGVVYGLVTVLGLAIEGDVLGLLINDADNYLHIVLALATFFGGYLTRGEKSLW